MPETIDLKQLCADLSETVIQLNNLRHEMIAELKAADHALEVAGFQDVQPVRAAVRAMIVKAEAMS